MTAVGVIQMQIALTVRDHLPVRAPLVSQEMVSTAQVGKYDGIVFIYLPG